MFKGSHATPSSALTEFQTCLRSGTWINPQPAKAARSFGRISCHPERSGGSIDDESGVEEPSPRDSAGAEAGGATDTSNNGLSSGVSHLKTSLLISIALRYEVI
jgi:hypothetical protein